MKFEVGIVDINQLLEEPFVNLSEIVDLVYSITLLESLFNHENTLVCWFTKCSVYVVNLELFVFNKTVHALSNHTQTLLNDFFKSTADRHYFTY